ncbi:MAG TPA: hypothetical protein VGH19_08210 [Verrucomicrobiae bacterium]
MNTQTHNHEVSQNSVCGHIAAIGACQKVLNAIEQARENLKSKFNNLREDHDHMVQLALNEAEALAWETTYPHLLFPTLAEEKVQAVNTWAVRQNAVRHGHRLAALAA